MAPKVTRATVPATLRLYSVVFSSKSATLVPSTVNVLKSASVLATVPTEVVSALHAPSPTLLVARTLTTYCSPALTLIWCSGGEAPIVWLRASAQVWVVVRHCTV